MARGSTWWRSQTNYARVLDDGRERRIPIPVPGVRGWLDQATVGSSPERSMMTDVHVWWEPQCAGWTGGGGGTAEAGRLAGEGPQRPWGVALGAQLYSLTAS